jgi:tripartite-type tricarboxylate transporter receptor subunit TctC
MHRASGIHKTARTALASAIAIAFLPFAQPTTGADYPLRPIRYIVPSAAGGGPDALARIFAAELSTRFGQQVVVDNRPGASGIIGTELIVRAAPDGYTIGHGNILTLAIGRSVLPKLPYDIDRDLTPVIQHSYTPNLLGVAPSLPVSSVAELIEHAKRNPGKLIFASTGNGSSVHVSGELFKLMTGTQIMHVPFKASALAISDLIAGRVHLMFDNISAISPHVKAGRVKGLAVTSAKRVPAFPDLPTVAEAGVPGFEVVAWSGVVVPRGVAQPIVLRLNQAINAALEIPSVRERIAMLGVEPLGGGTAEQFREHIRRETAKWADVVKRAGIKPD